MRKLLFTTILLIVSCNHYQADDFLESITISANELYGCNWTKSDFSEIIDITDSADCKIYTRCYRVFFKDQSTSNRYLFVTENNDKIKTHYESFANTSNNGQEIIRVSSCPY